MEKLTIDDHYDNSFRIQQFADNFPDIREYMNTWSEHIEMIYTRKQGTDIAESYISGILEGSTRYYKINPNNMGLITECTTPYLPLFNYLTVEQGEVGQFGDNYIWRLTTFYQGQEVFKNLPNISNISTNSRTLMAFFSGLLDTKSKDEWYSGEQLHFDFNEELKSYFYILASILEIKLHEDKQGTILIEKGSIQFLVTLSHYSYVHKNWIMEINEVQNKLRSILK